jgi:polyvinyl alcohol dehydrogenase (cytochrome)
MIRTRCRWLQGEFMSRNALLVLLLGMTALGSSQRSLAADEPKADLFGGQVFDIPDPATSGRVGQIYSSTCAACHDKGIERAPQRTLFIYMSPQSVYRALSDGAMRMQASSLSDGDKIAVAEFVTRRKMNDAPQAHEPPACAGKTADFDYGEPAAFSGWGFTPQNRRFVSADVARLDKSLVSRLRLKWAVAFPNAFQVRSQPAPAGGAVYVGSHNGGVYALERQSGCVRWIFQAGSEVRTGIVVSPWRAGDRTAKPLAYFGDVAGNVYAIDAVHGQLVWRVRADDNPSTITAAPALQGDTLYVSVSSFEAALPVDPHYECCKFRGSVVAYDAANGHVKWKTYTTDPPRLLGKNAKGANRYGPSGAPVWNTPTIDTTRHQLYVGTGENYSSPANDKSDAIIAMDLASGAVKWVYQGLAGDAMNLACVSADKTNCPEENGPDLDFGGAGTMLVSLPDGHQLVLAGQKSGDVYALNPDSGTLVWKAKPGRGGMLGGVHFGMAANSNRLFVPINDAPDGLNYSDPARPGVYALDLSNGHPSWSVPSDETECAGSKHCTVGYSQAITATPDLVLTGSDNGWLRIRDSRSGQLLWQVDTKNPVTTVTGENKGGGSFGGGAGPVVYHGMVLVSSGYSLAGQTPSNLLLAYTVQ